MQRYAEYDTTTGAIYAVTVPSGNLALPAGRAAIECEEFHASGWKVNPLTLQFEQLPPYVPTAEELQEKIDALLAQKAELEV